MSEEFGGASSSGSGRSLEWGWVRQATLQRGRIPAGDADQTPSPRGAGCLARQRPPAGLSVGAGTARTRVWSCLCTRHVRAEGEHARRRGTGPGNRFFVYSSGFRVLQFG